MSRASILNLLSLISALCVFFPGEKISIPFAVVLVVISFHSPLKEIFIFFFSWASFIYIAMADSFKFKKAVHSIIMIVILLSFLLLLGIHSMDFVKHANWLSISTAIIAILVISLTLREHIKQLRFSRLQNRKAINGRKMRMPFIIL